jgi:dsRNA-specific ribonuclease
VHHAGLQLASGRGKSKKAAESDAAKTALENLRRQRAAAAPAGTERDPK